MSEKIYKNVSELAKQKKLSIMEVEKRAELSNGTIGKVALEWMREQLDKNENIKLIIEG